MFDAGLWQTQCHKTPILEGLSNLYHPSVHGMVDGAKKRPHMATLRTFKNTVVPQSLPFRR